MKKLSCIFLIVNLFCISMLYGQSFDYGNMPSHPRLLLLSGEENRIKKAIETNRYLEDIHTTILNYSDKVLNEAPVERIKEGKRLLSISRKALRRIFYLSYAYRMTHEVKYLHRAENELLAVCEFEDWNPSHFLDVGEMATAVAIGYDWLFDDLREETKGKIREALISKAFEASKDKRHNWFLNNRANWNQVCNTGLLLAALAIFEDAKEASVEMIERALETIKLPLQEYGPDGNFSEGYMYWTYGTTFQVMFLSALEKALGDDKGLHKTKGFMETAHYMLYMTGSVGQCFSYSDSSIGIIPNLAMFWFASKSKDNSLLFVEKETLQKGFYTKSFGENRLLPLILLFADPSMLEDIEAPSQKMWVGRGITPVALIRTGWNGEGDKYVGIKGGKASASHAHMDAGSFVYESQGVRWAVDLGMQSYYPLESKGVDLWNMKQNSQRWDVFRLNNESHNVITIDGKRHLVDGKATIDKIFDSDAERGVQLKMTPVYGDKIKDATRSIILYNEDYLQIEDKISTKSEAVSLRWNMVTSAMPTIVDAKTIKLEKSGKVLFLKVNSDLDVTLKIDSTAPRANFDDENKGTVMVGFDAVLPENSIHTFSVQLDHILRR